MKKTKSIENPNYESILWNDLYKFTMQWAIIKNFPNTKVKYKFFDRNQTKYPKNFGFELRKIVDSFRNVKLSPIRKKEFMKACPYLPAVYFDFLEGYKFDPSEVGIIQDGNDLSISIEGYWFRTVLWEVPLMATICDLYYRMTEQACGIDYEKSFQRTKEKSNYFGTYGIQFADFGTRRAYSPDHHENIINAFVESFMNEKFIGSSNVELALYNKIKPIGTYAHEFVSGIAALYGYTHANKYAMDFWTKTYNGNLGIALTDTFTTDAFLRDFDTKYANLFTGVRHDSGSPFKFTNKIIEHYKKLGIDPTTKTIVFSDGLNPTAVVEINNYRKSEIRKSYGIGTNLTNDIPNIKPMNIVIKLVEVNNLPAIKISDNIDKAIGDKETIKYVNWLNSKY